jgi:hypothetical protein
MNAKRVHRRASDRDRRQALTLATAARRRLDEDSRVCGRIWVNGREIGGASERFTHLDRSHD